MRRWPRPCSARAAPARHRRAGAQRDVEKAFAAQKIKVQVSGREKTIYSIYRKMREKHAGFAQVNDIFGFRIVVPTLPDCYLALGVLHQLYKPVPGRFKDYIAIPKANGYQSLHTTLVSPLGTAVEFQIRTEAMHAVAEKGIAAHWLYKAGDKGKNGGGTEAQRLGAMWLQSLLDIQDETRDAAEFLEHVKIDLYPDAVYVFTPKSKILALPRGATPVDFAYAIHSDVGDHTVAAKVNGEPVALRTELRSGDVVEIITAPAPPNPAWLNIVRTGRARSKIRHYLKTWSRGVARAGREDAGPGAARRGPEAALGRPRRRRRPPRCGSSSRAGAATAPRRAAGRHRPGPQDRHHRRQAAGAADAERGARPDAVTLTLGRYAAPTTRMPAQGVVFVDGSEGARCSWRPAAGRSRATRSSATWAAAKAWWCTPPNATPASGCSSATASAGCGRMGRRA
jgi:GTP diphosphokinase / guanosine-3',5'-bis(diphosphate) 3'-diphosphatase